ncbi:MAG TPA: DUF2892 domain-containing protein [Candidatus Fimivivens sp.]|nr:DUF2892 domain-containing protein [Candidatus Fimivivens sp.]
MPQKNVGHFDRVLRIALGILILSVAIYFESLWGILGLVMIASGTIRFCPVYFPFGISTHREKKI